jgi:putative transcriptional regulator
MKKRARNLVRGLSAVLDYVEGRPIAGAKTAVVHVPDVKAIRERLKMSQSEFAETYRIPVGTLRNWEQGLRRPDAPAASYLRVIAKQPKVVREALN